MGIYWYAHEVFYGVVVEAAAWALRKLVSIEVQSLLRGFFFSFVTFTIWWAGQCCNPS